MELELPDLGLILVEDAETGEQLLADTSDPLFRQRLRGAGRRPARRRWPTAMRRAGVDRATGSPPIRTWSRALIDMVRRSKRRRAPMTLPVPARWSSSRRWSRAAAGAGLPGAAPAAGPGAGRRRPRRAGRAGWAACAGTCRPRCSCIALTLLLLAVGPSAGDASTIPRAAGTVDPRLRRVQQHDRDRRDARPGWPPPRPPRPASSRRSRTRVDVGRGRVRPGRADHPPADQRPRRGDRRHQAAARRPAVPRWARRSSRR